MLKNRLIITLTFLDGILFRTKKFKPDYRYTKNFVDLWSIDEIMIIDLSEKKFQSNFLDTIKFFSENCFVPLTVGGGIKNLENATTYFDHGADKIVLGSGSVIEGNAIQNISDIYGSQSIIQSIDCKKENENYKLTIKSGTILTDIDPIEASQKALKLGAGEIMINNIDNDGSLLGYDIDFLTNVSKKIECPVLALGGAGNWSHIVDLFKLSNVTGACTQNIFHFTEESISSAKNFLIQNEILVRN